MPTGLLKRLQNIFIRVAEGKKDRRDPRDIPPITPEEVEEIRAFFPLKKFFIYGHARSGTTLLARLIRLHPQVHCNWQAHFFTRPPLLQSLVADKEVGAWLSRRSNRWNRGRDLSPLVLRAVGDFILEREARRVGKIVVGDKSPNSLLNGESVELLYKIYPDASLIFIVRDGRDAVISHRFQSFIDKAADLSKEDLLIRDAFIRNPQKFVGGGRSLFTEKILRAAASRWVENVQETDRLGRSLFGDRYISLRYEDLLSQTLREIERLWNFLDVDPNITTLAETIMAEMENNPDADWQQEAGGEFVRWFRKGEPGIWRELFTLTDRLVFENIGGETLKSWGYKG